MSTQTLQTVTQYLAKAKQLYEKAEADLPDGGILTHMYVVHWNYSRLKSGFLKANTWRFYKAALVCYLEQLNEDKDAAEALVDLRALGNDGTRKPTNEGKSSGRKLKYLTPEMEFRFFEEWLPSRRTTKNLALRDWLVATLNTGARPCEWEDAILVNNGSHVRFKNAKDTNGRANGKYRTVPIHHLDHDLKVIIKSHIERVSEFMLEHSNFQSLKKSMENAVCYESRKCYPGRKLPHISLYTMRHQFAANCKASGLTKQDVAALMGHAVDYTATEHYARKTVGNKIDGLKGVPEEAARVRTGKPNPFLRNPDANQPIDVVNAG